MRLVIFVVLIICVSAVLNFATYSPTEYHRLQNHELYSDKQYDLIAFGSSDCRANFDPQVAKNELGIDCFNYGGSATTYFSGGVEASLNNALMAQNFKKAVFYVPYDLFSIPEEEMNNESELIFIHSTLEMRNPLAKMKYALRASKETGAIERFFPWISLRKEAEVMDFINKKSEEGYRLYDKEWRNQYKSSIPYMGDGFVAYSEGGMKEPDAEKLLNQSEEENQFEDETGYDLIGLLRLCEKEGIQAYVVMQPKHVKCITLRDYITSKKIKEIVEKNNGTFIDVNMVRSEEFRIPTEDWNSATHLSLKGAGVYTQELCKIIKGDVPVGFYTNYDEFLDSVF